MRLRWREHRLPVGLAAVCALCLAVPASGTTPAQGSAALAGRVSQAVALHYWLAHPAQAPAPLRAGLQRARQLQGSAPAGGVGVVAPVAGVTRFNHDDTGLPQNEESVTSCRSRPNIVLGGTNDYRGLIDPQGNFTGWDLSTDSGGSVAAEGLLPPVSIFGAQVPSGGDPVVSASADCRFYAGSLAYDPNDPFNHPNGIAVYRSSPHRLLTCPGGSSPQCWVTRRAVAKTGPSNFLDKEWIYAGKSGSAGDEIGRAHV